MLHGCRKKNGIPYQGENKNRFAPICPEFAIDRSAINLTILE